MVVAFDRGATEFCLNHSVVTMPAEQQMQEADFRGSASKFRLMGSLKPKMVLRLFEDYGFQTIVLADTDTVWLREPSSAPRLNATNSKVVLKCRQLDAKYAMLDH